MFSRFGRHRAWGPGGIVRPLLFKRGSQEPVALQPLHQIIGLHHGVRNLAKNLIVRLDLRVEIARDVRQVQQGLIQARRQHGNVRVGGCQRRVGGGQRLLQLQINIRWNQPIAQGSIPVRQERGNSEQIAHERPRLDNGVVKIRGEADGVRYDTAQLVG